MEIIEFTPKVKRLEKISGKSDAEESLQVNMYCIIDNIRTLVKTPSKKRRVNLDEYLNHYRGVRIKMLERGLDTSKYDSQVSALTQNQKMIKIEI